MLSINKWKIGYFALLLLAIIAIPVFSQSVMLGDVNNDEIINIIDSLFTAQYYVKMNPSPFIITNADVDGNTIINIIDSLYIAQFYIKLIDQFPAETDSVYIPWDITGIIGTGQSLAVGVKAKPIVTVTQPYNNLKLDKKDLTWPIASDDPLLVMVPLTEPINQTTTKYPSSWPANILGETPHTAMANQITDLVRKNHDRDYISAHSCVGEDGKALSYIQKKALVSGINGRAYEASMIETRAMTRLAKEQGKSYGVGAIILTHGESDTDNPEYQAGLYQLWKDYDQDIKAITGQTDDVLMILSQQNTWGDHSLSTIAEWKIGVDYKENIVCSGPKYQYIYSSDIIHLTAEGYQQLGEKYAQVYYQRVILKNDWQPLQPIEISRVGNQLNVKFHIPVAPLKWEDSFQKPHENDAQWMNGNGFEVTSERGRETIQSVEISGDTVIITCSEDLPRENIAVAYAMSRSNVAMKMPHQGTVRWGLLKDSDNFTGLVTGKEHPNYAVAFELAVPDISE